MQCVYLQSKGSASSPDGYDEPTERPKHSYDLPENSASTSVSVIGDYDTQPPTEPSADQYSSGSASLDIPSESTGYGYTYGQDSSESPTLSGYGKGKGGKGGKGKGGKGGKGKGGKGGKGKGGKGGKRQ